jgi:hypothetical protein
VYAQKGKGKRYRRELNDPYSGAESKPETKKPPKQTADNGPVNAVFTADEETEEYFLFVRKVKRAGGDEGGGEGGGVQAAASIEARRELRSQQMGKRNIGSRNTEDEETAITADVDAVPSTGDDDASSLDRALIGLGMRGPASSPQEEDATATTAGGTPRLSKQLGIWLPLGDVVVRAGGNMDVVVAERRKILTAFAKRKHLKMLPVAADEALEFGLRVQCAPQRGPDPAEVFPVAVAASYANLVWNARAAGDRGAERAELRLMNSMPNISSHKKNEMLSSAMGMIKAQQEKAAALVASPPDDA